MREYRTDENPMAADDVGEQHLKRAIEILEHEAEDGEIDQRAVFDAMAHMRVATVRNIIGETE